MICSFCKEPLPGLGVKHDIYDCMQYIDAKIARLRAELAGSYRVVDTYNCDCGTCAAIRAEAHRRKHLADCEG